MLLSYAKKKKKNQDIKQYEKIILYQIVKTYKQVEQLSMKDSKGKYKLMIISTFW